MFNHVMVGCDDLEAGKAFYDATLTALGFDPGVVDDKGRVFWLSKFGTFGITKPINGEPATFANGGTIGFRAESEDAVNAWHEAGKANGGIEIEDPPGIRTGVTRKLYLAYLRDPAGNKLCAVYRMKD
jgi:catechol 2,3-dioxygenase-like lactoylglutathione lyase family enzyme